MLLRGRGRLSSESLDLEHFDVELGKGELGTARLERLQDLLMLARHLPKQLSMSEKLLDTRASRHRVRLALFSAAAFVRACERLVCKTR